MSADAAITLSVLALTLMAAAREWASLDMVVLMALFVLVTARAAELETVLQGFANPAVLTIGSLLVVASGLRATGILQDLAPKVLGSGGTLRSVLLRLTTTTAAGSAFGPLGVLIAVFVGTAVLTETIVNQAAALAFPVVAAAAAQGLDPRPLVIAATVAASFSFSTPLSYQTNLMVYGPGGYKFTDFLRAGLPMQLLPGATAIALIWLLYPVGVA